MVDKTTNHKNFVANAYIEILCYRLGKKEAFLNKTNTVYVSVERAEQTNSSQIITVWMVGPIILIALDHIGRIPVLAIYADNR